MEQSNRAASRGQVTRVVNAVTEFFAANQPPKDVDDLDVSAEEELLVLKERLRAAAEKLTEANAAIKADAKAEPAQLAKEREQEYDYDDKVIAAKARIEHRLSRYNLLRNPPNKLNLAENVKSEPQHIKLPKLELRKFDGEIKNWLPFWEQLRSAVHANKALSASDKFNYLQTLLVGKAEKTIAVFTPTELCYNEAINLLQEQYGGEDRLIDQCMQQLMNLQLVITKEDMHGLQRLYNTITTTTRSLQALGVNASQYNIILKPLILRSLPNELRVAYHRTQYKDTKAAESSVAGLNSTTAENSQLNDTHTSENNDKQVQTLIDFIRRELEAREKAIDGRRNLRATATAATPSKSVSNRQNTFTAAGLLTANVQVCLFCKSKCHSTANCDDKSVTIEKKKVILSNGGYCFRCAKPNHNSKQCRNSFIKCNKCNWRHASSMCDPNYKKNKNVNDVGNDSEVKRSETSVNLFTVNKSLPLVHLQTACCFIRNPVKSDSVFIRLVLDSGSQATFIRESISRQLDLPVLGMHRMSILTFGSKQERPRLFKRVQLNLQGQYGNELMEIEAIEVPEICLDMLTPANDCNINLKNLRLADTYPEWLTPESGISLLIGSDQYWRIVTGELEDITSSLKAVNTKLGWTLQGPVSNDDISVTLSTAFSLHVSVKIDNEFDIRKFWDLETLGIRDINEPKNLESQNFIENNVVVKNGCYSVSLPWRDRRVALNENRLNAIARLRLLTTKLSRDWTKFMEYDKVIRSYIENGYAETVTKEAVSGPIYYMPHRAVYRDDKTTSKVRVVFDASSSERGCTSLNEHLCAGENLNSALLKILLNFRLGKIGLVADIEKAFLQVHLSDSDKDTHRFLWYKEEINETHKIPPVQEFRMNRVTFGVTSSPFLLAAVIKKHLLLEHQRFPETCDTLSNSFYVDDLVVSVDNLDNASKLFNESCTIMTSAGMNLRKWNTNELSLYEIFKNTHENSELPTQQGVLGMRWFILSDEINVKLENPITFISDSLSATKRNILQLLSRIYDPLGLLGPFTVRMKILLQQVWRLKLDWDEVIPSELHKMWTAWREELPLLKDFTVPRCVFSKVSNKLETIDLHIFADASPIAFGMVAYVKSINEDNDVNVRLLCSKNRVAPMRTRNTPELTLPKLELTAILLAAKHLSYLRKNLTIKFSATYIWSDSKIALHWVANPNKKCESYIKNRVREITELTSDVVWKHCPGEHNPADLLTRGVKVRQLLTSDRWLHGPDWLSQVTQHCFSTNEFPDNVISTLVTTETNDGRERTINVMELTQPEKYSNLGKLLRITAYVLRFGQILRKKVVISSEVLTAAEIEKAENLWVRIVQQDFYSNELFCLVKGQQLPISSKIATLNLFLDDEGLIRVGGRLQFAEGNLSFKHPIILPKESAFSRLVILYFHERAFHGGVVATLTLIRQRYWITHARQVTKSIINRCTVCRWLRAHPLSQPFAPLPKDRIVVSRPFEVTGLDFAGPLFIKEENTQKKVYILLFTCASIRAVHLELVPDLSTEACIRAIRRFISRRGVPRRFYSDNAKTFKRASVEFKELSHFVESRSLNEFVLKQRTEWRFIVERAAWWGGWWERLIRSVKDALKATIRRSILNFDQLQTLLVEIEFIVNSRPLTYLSPDPNDPEPLSPAHFLFNAMPNVLPIADKKDFTSMNTDIVKIWKQRQGLLSKFWKRWATDYLQQLRSAHHMPKKFSSTISRGDVVLISEQSTPRLLWKIAVVETTYPGRDGKVRACELRLPNGHKLRRPIQYLYPLELSGESLPQAAGEDVKKIINYSKLATLRGGQTNSTHVYYLAHLLLTPV